jgi:ribosomal protein L35
MNHSHHRHNLGLKTAKRKRNLRTSEVLSASMTPTARKMIQQ